MYACDAADSIQNAAVGTEHLLIGILKIKDAKLTELLKQEGITDQTIEQEVQILFGFASSNVKAGYTSTLTAVLKDAEMKAHQHHEDEVTIDELSASLLERENNVALELLKRSGIVIEQLIEELNQTDMFQGIKELRNLNQAVASRKGKVMLREKELTAMIHVLMRMEKSNCVLTGPAGVGKTAIVEELAYRIEKKLVPDALKDCIVAELNINLMVAGTKYRGEFEKKIQHLLELLQRQKNIILFIDELHLIVGAGKAEGSLDIASVLKPVLSRGTVKVIGATTQEEYERWIQKDKALQRRFVRIEVNEPDKEMTAVMMKEKIKDLSHYHGIKVQRGLIKECIHTADILFPELKYPDKAIDLMDMSCSLAKSQQLDFVTTDCLQQAASLMSRKPLKVNERIKELNQENCMMNESQKKMIADSLEKVLIQNETAVWKWKSGEHLADQMKELLRKTASACIHEFDAFLFQGMNVQDVFHFLSVKLTAPCFHVLWIHHADALRTDLKELFEKKQVDQLSIIYETKATLKGILIVLYEHEERCKIGFYPQTVNKRSSVSFELI